MICDGERLVGFVMAGFDPAHPVEPYRSCLWRLNIAADLQGQGYGSFAVAEVCAEQIRQLQGAPVRRARPSWTVPAVAVPVVVCTARLFHQHRRPSAAPGA